jgi:hypothetical protein
VRNGGGWWDERGWPRSLEGVVNQTEILVIFVQIVHRDGRL